MRLTALTPIISAVLCLSIYSSSLCADARPLKITQMLAKKLEKKKQSHEYLSHNYAILESLYIYLATAELCAYDLAMKLVFASNIETKPPIPITPLSRLLNTLHYGLIQATTTAPELMDHIDTVRQLTAYLAPQMSVDVELKVIPYLNSLRGEQQSSAAEIFVVTYSLLEAFLFEQLMPIEIFRFTYIYESLVAMHKDVNLGETADHQVFSSVNHLKKFRNEHIKVYLNSAEMELVDSVLVAILRSIRYHVRTDSGRDLSKEDEEYEDREFLRS